MDKLNNLYLRIFNKEAKSIVPLNGAGSNRRYFRIVPQSENEKSIIGVIGTSVDENMAFYNLHLEFANRNIAVPRVYAIDEDGIRYLQQDLGDCSLYDLISRGRNNGAYDEKEKQLIKLVIAQLPRIQFEMDSDVVYEKCYPLKTMDRTSIMFDLNYFKYCYLKISGVEFNELKLQEDFEKLADYLLSVHEYGFQYRDFQARNIMIFNEIPFYIDFQGGRRGPIYYDLASFLWQASSNFSEDLRNEMINIYLNNLEQYKTDISIHQFKQNLSIFVLFRILQVLGAYGFRGLWEKKEHFIKSIPMALKNLNSIIANDASDDFNYLRQVCMKLIDINNKSDMNASNHYSNARQLVMNDASYFENSGKPLVVRVFSFSYKKGIPEDTSGNGGGYVFDCRSTHNPGRYQQYKQINGLESPVVNFLEEDGEILTFLDSVYKIVDFHVKRFIERGFTDIMLSFGCTGGQHRSVYSAQHVAEHIHKKFGVEVRIIHREQNISMTLAPATS